MTVNQNTSLKIIKLYFSSSQIENNKNNIAPKPVQGDVGLPNHSLPARSCPQQQQQQLLSLSLFHSKMLFADFSNALCL